MKVLGVIIHHLVSSMTTFEAITLYIILIQLNLQMVQIHQRYWEPLIQLSSSHMELPCSFPDLLLNVFPYAIF